MSFFFWQPAAGLTNRVPVWDSQAGTPLLSYRKISLTTTNIERNTLTDSENIKVHCGANRKKISTQRASEETVKRIYDGGIGGSIGTSEAKKIAFSR